MVEKGSVDKKVSIEENFFDNTPPIKQISIPEKRIAIVGSRAFKDYSIVKDIMSYLFSNTKILEIVSGGAEGADYLGKKYAEEKEIPLKEFLPEWDNLSHPDAVIKENRWGKKYDSRAGFRRNRLIVERADVILAFWDGKSSGTKNTISIADKMGKHYLIYNYEIDRLYSSVLNGYTENIVEKLRKGL